MEPVDKILIEWETHTLAFDDARPRLYVFMPKKCQAAVYNEVNFYDITTSGISPLQLLPVYLNDL
jgi:hypothetical protein